MIATILLTAALVGGTGQQVDASTRAQWTLSATAEPVLLDVASGKAQRVTLRVLDDASRPIPDVSVTLSAPPDWASIDNRSAITVVTDKQGRVRFRLRPTKEVGPWQLRALATRGSETADAAVSITNGVADRNEKKALGMGVFALLIGAISLLGTLAAL